MGHYGNARYQCGIKKQKRNENALILSFYTYMHTHNYTQFHPYPQLHLYSSYIQAQLNTYSLHL
jgi:hypothetical protein